MTRAILAGGVALALLASPSAMAQTPDETARALAIEAERQDRAEAAAEAAPCSAARCCDRAGPHCTRPRAGRDPCATACAGSCHRRRLATAPSTTARNRRSAPAFGLWGSIAESMWVGKDGRTLFSYKWNARRDAVTGEIYDGSLVARRTAIYRDPVGEGLRIDVTYPDGRKTSATIQNPDDVTAIQTNAEMPGARTVYHRASATISSSRTRNW